MMTFKNWWPEILLILLSMLMGIAARGIVDRAHIESLKADLAGVKAGYAEEKSQTAKAALARLQLANQRADSLQVALDTTEQRLAITQTEMNREIQRNTTGRACLNARTVRLLNAPPAGNQPAAVPAPAGGPAEEDAAIATDTDVAGWINQAKAQYATCRARFNALIDWHAPDTPNTESDND